MPDLRGRARVAPPCHAARVVRLSRAPPTAQRPRPLRRADARGPPQGAVYTAGALHDPVRDGHLRRRGRQPPRARFRVNAARLPGVRRIPPLTRRVRPDVVLFNSWGGKLADSPRAISEELHRRDAPFERVWVLDEGA